MSANPNSTIGQMLYAQRPPLVMGQLVSDLDHALAALIGPLRRLTWDGPQMACFDFDGGRIIVAYVDSPCPPWQGCLTVTVGDGDSPSAGRLARRHNTLAHKIVEDIARHHAPDSVRWLSMPMRMDADVLAGITRQLDYASETQAALARGQDVNRARNRLPRLDMALVDSTDTRLRGVLDQMRQAQAQSEAQFDRQPRQALTLWARLSRWLGRNAQNAPPSPALFAQPAPLRRIG